MSALPYRKKLIEVALPLDAINAESAREKSIRHGHPSTLHLWWARRPLAACRAVLFASLVDDPGEYLPENEAKRERDRLFKLIEQLVKWENSNNEVILAAAREEIRKSTNGNPPPVLDPFAGGGSIPLEAQRLGLEAHASDLNPVAVLINKALIELPAKFRDHKPVNPDAQNGMKAEVAPKSALAEDVRWYGRWMRDEAYKRIGQLYPKGPNGEMVIAWLWARTVKCPNPACGARMPLVRSFALSTKKGKEAWVEPLVDHQTKTVCFAVRQGPGVPDGTRKRGATCCLFCGNLAADGDLRRQALQFGLDYIPLAMVCEARGRRTYYPCAMDSLPHDIPEADTEHLQAEMPANPRWFSPPVYGLTTYADLFTPRQLAALTTFSDLVGEAHNRVLDHSGGDVDYADAVATYLGLGLGKAASRNCMLAIWETGMDRLAGAFGRQAIPMTWDFAETNPFAGAGGDIAGTIESVCEVLERLALSHVQRGEVQQRDATAPLPPSYVVVATDPPYYDNVGYADLSDFFYLWLRRTLKGLYPDLFSTLLTPKGQELIASPYRFDGNHEQARQFFETGLSKAFNNMHAVENPAYPMTVYYAYKQAEGDSSDGQVASTGWETMLQGLMDAGFMITGTWPVRSELTSALKKLANALASSIVLVCRPRLADAPLATRREFTQALQSEMPKALNLLIKGAADTSSIAPVDLAQAAIGPGMAIFSRYTQVLEASGEPMRVRTALELINAEINRYFSDQEGEHDPPTRFCLAWYRSYGSGEGKYGEAETLSKATNVDINALKRQGLLTSGAGKVRLKLAHDYPDGSWDPATANPLTNWEVTHRLVAALAREGEAAAAPIVRRLGGKAEEARDLAYLLYTEADKRGWQEEARGYNDLVVSWPAILKNVAESGGPEQVRMF